MPEQKCRLHIIIFRIILSLHSRTFANRKVPVLISILHLTISLYCRPRSRSTYGITSPCNIHLITTDLQLNSKIFILIHYNTSIYISFQCAHILCVNRPSCLRSTFTCIPHVVKSLATSMTCHVCILNNRGNKPVTVHCEL